MVKMASKPFVTHPLDSYRDMLRRQAKTEYLASKKTRVDWVKYMARLNKIGKVK